MNDDISKFKDSLKFFDSRDKEPQDVSDIRKYFIGVSLSKLDMSKTYNSSFVSNRVIDTFDFLNGTGYLNSNAHDNKKINIQDFEDFVFDKVAKIKFNKLVAKKKKNLLLFKEMTNEILSAENIKKSAFDLLIKYNNESGFYFNLISFLSRDDVVDSKKLRFSIINLISKSVEISEVKGVDINFTIDEISHSIVLNLVKKPIAREYMVNLNLKFKPNGSVSFMCYDSDDSDKSYITGSVSRYDTYMSSMKFKTIIDMLESGA